MDRSASMLPVRGRSCSTRAPTSPSPPFCAAARTRRLPQRRTRPFSSIPTSVAVVTTTDQERSSCSFIPPSNACARLTTLERTNLIIIDDWGPEPLAAEQRRDLLEIVDDRYDKGSLLITSQVPIAQWHDIIADPTLGDAILDRIIHNAHRIQLKGDSLRRRAGEKKRA